MAILVNTGLYIYKQPLTETQHVENVKNPKNSISYTTVYNG